jgi:23S rRNA (uridine2552-2'-O)-methyltransferase
MSRPKLNDKFARHDEAYLRAKRENYAARAVYKLEEIDQRFRLVRAGMRVLDLGCWPGSWMQYVAAKVGDEGLVYGIDLRPVNLSFPANVHHAIADVFTWTPAELGPDVRFDLVLSDMAPHTTGDTHNDKWKSEGLAARALEVARQALRPGGHLVAKVFQGGQFPDLLKAWREAFQETKPFHARNTRASSSEQYLVGRGLRPSAMLPASPPATAPKV